MVSEARYGVGAQNVGSCAICVGRVLRKWLTVASVYVDGTPALGCEAHRADNLEWSYFWAIFRRQQLRILEERGWLPRKELL